MFVMGCHLLVGDNKWVDRRKIPFRIEVAIHGMVGIDR
jgi:hypothetical protein